MSKRTHIGITVLGIAGFLIFGTVAAQQQPAIPKGVQPPQLQAAKVGTSTKGASTACRSVVKKDGVEAFLVTGCIKNYQSFGEPAPAGIPTSILKENNAYVDPVRCRAIMKAVDTLGAYSIVIYSDSAVMCEQLHGAGIHQHEAEVRIRASLPTDAQIVETNKVKLNPQTTLDGGLSAVMETW